ncbi:oxidoreductase [Aeromicrobium alkaliterrae]|uniref:Oxidoreductase n=1 Tax=Aeromicrobium alkaliterrae TaxID=302168 RepID=A0ABN2K3I5_9ACTN
MSGPESSPADPFGSAAALEGLPSLYAGTRDGIDTILRDRGLRRTTPEDTATSLLGGAAASATLEGSPVTADELAGGEGDPTARGALRLSSELLGLVPTWSRSPVQALARMHAVATAGVSPDAGRPVNPAGVARLGNLTQVLGRPTAAPGLVVAALVHAEIVTAGAFGSHNGVVARAAERLVLVVTGVDPASVTVPEAGHAAEPDGYRAALAAYGRATSAGTQQWLQYAAQAFSRGAEASPVARGLR